MAEEDRGFNILSRYKNNVAWKIKDTYTSVPDIGTEYGTWGKGKSPQDYGIHYERRLNPIERTNLHTNVDSDAYPINPEGDFRDPTATNYSRDDNIRKQKTKSIINQKFQSKGKTKLLKKQSTRSLLTKDLKTKKPTSVKGGSAGQWQGGGGKRVMGIKSPWEWIKRRLD